MSHMINMLVDRQHVGTSHTEVVRYVLSRLKGGRAAFRTWPKAERRKLVERAYNRHQSNRRLYNTVMGGRPS